jgi:hypothetical protein
VSFNLEDRMKKRLLISLLVVLTISTCTKYEYFSNIESNLDFSGKWSVNNSNDRIMIVKKTEDNFYSLKLTSPERDWEGIGYQITDELLAIFKYVNQDGKGYVTFHFINPNLLYAKSINPDGSIRSEAYYNKLKSP